MPTTDPTRTSTYRPEPTREHHRQGV